MTRREFAGAYVPDMVPEEDLAYFDKGQMGERVGWGESPALVVVDMTLAFVSEEYPTGRSDTGRRAVRANRRLLDAAHETNTPVFYTKSMDDLPLKYRGTVKSKPDPDRRSKLSEGNVIPDEIEPRSEDVVIQKPRASAFFDTHFSTMLREDGIDTLVVTGMVTSGCIRATVVDAHSNNFRTIVPIECVADRCISSHEMSLFDMDMKYADVTPLDDVIVALKN